LRILISGYYGFDNIGDEALLAVMVARMRERLPRAEIEVLSARPDVTRHALRVDAVPRADLSQVRRAIGRASVVVSGGGGLLQNATSTRSLVYYAGTIRAAIAARKPAMIFAQSIGPLDLVGRGIVRQCLRGLSAATVRDERSRAVLTPLAAPVAVERSADPVFLLDAPEPDGLALHGIDERSDPLVIVSVRPCARFNEGVPRIAAAVDRLATAYGARVGFVPFGGAPDAEASTIVMRACRSKPTLLPVDDIASAARIFARARMVIGMRLHALILAIRLGVPFLAIPYDPKVSGLCDDIAYPLEPLWVPGAPPAAPASAADAVDAAWARHDELAERLRADAERLRSLALVSFSVLERIAAAA
jgi:polysaccharide pyruvyl transferase CsaB